MESEQDNAEQTSRQPDAHHEPDPERDTSSGAGRPTGQQHPGTDPNARPEAAPAESSTEFPGDTQGNAPGGPASGPGDPVTGTAGAGTSAPGDTSTEDPSTEGLPTGGPEPEGAAPPESDAPEPEGPPTTQDAYGAFGAGVSLMFHAPDPDEIRRAAEQQSLRLREAAQERETQRRQPTQEDADEEDPSSSVSSRRRRRRRRGDEDLELVDEADGTVTRVRAPRVSEPAEPTEVVGVKGSTRLEAKRQRRRDSRQSGRRRHVITEAEFLARREAVERKMLVRQKDNRIQIGVLEDGVLAEHFVSHTQQDSLIGNVYVGKVQNVLPSMEAAFVDIGRGRNAVLYAGEVDWDAAELGHKPRKIENALKSGNTVLVQVTKDPVGHKGARLTSQVSLPGRYLVYVPGGSMTGISRKLPDVERQRLKKILKDRLPEGAGVIVRTAAEGASEDELTNDINRLRSQWEQIQEKAASTKTLAPEMLYAEPDLTIKTVRDVFNEDFTEMVVQGEHAWDNIEAYVTYVAPDLLDRLHLWNQDEDLFESYRVAEQIQKALERKVYLPSGGSLVIDRTEAMTVVDVNTGKFTGSGGNLEETVTKNNLEAAEEIVRQVRLRDIGGIIVVDFIDMVLESNRDLVLRRLVECLGRDRTKHQVAEVTSLGLVQMTRKRMGTGLLEVFSEPCETCAGRGVVVHDHPLTGHPGGTGQDPRHNRNERKRSRHKPPQPQQDKAQDGNGSGGQGQEQADEGSKARAEATRTAFATIAAASQQEDTAAPGTPEAGSEGREHEQQGPPKQHKDHGEAQDGEHESGRRKKRRRGKRSRGRPQAAGEQQEREERETATEPGGAGAAETGADRSSSLTIQGEVIELPHGGEQHGETAAEPEDRTLSLDSLTAAFTRDPDGPGEEPAGTDRQADGPRDTGRADAPARPETPATDPEGPAAPAPRQAPEETAPAGARPRRRSRRASAPAAAPGTAGVRTHEPEADEEASSRFTSGAARGQQDPKQAGGPTVVGVGVPASQMKMTGGSQK